MKDVRYTRRLTEFIKWGALGNIQLVGCCPDRQEGKVMEALKNIDGNDFVAERFK